MVVMLMEMLIHVHVFYATLWTGKIGVIFAKYWWLQGGNRSKPVRKNWEQTGLLLEFALKSNHRRRRQSLALRSGMWLLHTCCLQFSEKLRLNVGRYWVQQNAEKKYSTPPMHFCMRSVTLCSIGPSMGLVRNCNIPMASVSRKCSRCIYIAHLYCTCPSSRCI